MSPRTRLFVVAISVLSILVLAGLLLFWPRTQNGSSAAKEVRVLAWVGYEESEIVEPFEREFGVKVQTETFTGADKMFAKLTNSPDAYDVVVIDPEYIAKLHAAGLLTELDPSQFDFSHYIEPMRRFPLCWIDGKMYTVLVRFGVNAIVYNTQKLTKEEVSSYGILWSAKVKGKVGIWDWYLPNMGVVSLSAGFDPPYKLDEQQFAKISERLQTLRPQVKAILGSFSDVNAALARGDVWVVPALGEHTAAVLSEEGHPVDWIVPKEGGIMWIETLGIPPLAGNKAAALKYIQYIQRPQVQAKLTWRRAYRSNIPDTLGISLLTSRQQDALKVHNGAEAKALVNAIKVRRLPEDRGGRLVESKWQALWQQFKAGK